MARTRHGEIQYEGMPARLMKMPAHRMENDSLPPPNTTRLITPPLSATRLLRETNQSGTAASERTDAGTRRVVLSDA
jgi:hypothetical protein